jgi:phosphoribosyl 1,2-cyclic phosphodiesterase
VRLSVLGSGSGGNALLVDTGVTRLLVDAGLGPRTLARRLAAVGCAPESITALVLTHEHQDHAVGAPDACARWQWPLFATAGTLAALPSGSGPRHVITHGSPWMIGDVEGISTPVPHDAADCAAFVFTAQTSGARLGVALDAGHVPPTLLAAFDRLDGLVIESNHDAARLAGGPYPWALKQRIRGGRGHLSNRQAADLVHACAHPGLRTVVLAHLSETNNTPTLALEALRGTLRRHGSIGRTIARGVQVAAPRTPLGPLPMVVRATGEGQFELAL